MRDTRTLFQVPRTPAVPEDPNQEQLQLHQALEVAGAPRATSGPGQIELKTKCPPSPENLSGDTEDKAALVSWEKREARVGCPQQARPQEM